MPLVSRNELGAAMVKAVAGLGGATDTTDAADAADAGMLIGCCAGIDHAATRGFMDEAIAALRYMESNRGGDVLPAPIAALRILDFVMGEGEWRGKVMGAGFLAAGMVLLGRADRKAVLCMSDDSGSVVAVLNKGAVMLRDGALADGEYGIAPAEADTKGLAGITENPGAVEVEDSRWRVLMDYAALSYVPETEESRKRGAGAGDIDND